MARDPRTEQYLSDQHVDYAYVPSVPIEGFDLTASLDNQARLTGELNKDTVQEYAQAMIEGVDFPAVVSVRPNGKDVLVSGNHRLHAAIEAEIKTFDTYRIQTADPFLIERLTRSINSIEGMRPSRSEAVAQAAYLVEKRGMTTRAAAAEFHIPEAALSRALRTAASRRRLTAMALSTNDMAETHLEVFNAIKSDRVLKPVAELVQQARMPVEVVKALVAEVRTKANEDEQLRTVQAWRSRPDVKDRIGKYKGGTVKKPVRGADNATRLLTAFGAIANIVAPAKSLADLNITSPKEQERVNQAWLEVKAAVQAVIRGR